MKKRKIIKIDENKCDGCGACIPNCPEGALRVIDGKARLVSDPLCDGLGACLGECPKGAITVEEREAAAYDEEEVMRNMVIQGPNTVKAHLRHLKDHGQDEYLAQALAFLKSKGISNPLGESGRQPPVTGHKPESQEHKNTGHAAEPVKKSFCGCPGARELVLGCENGEEAAGDTAVARSQLRQWPVQMHLISPSAPYFKKADVVLAADCVAYACGNFHNGFLKGKALAIACPKLDEGQESYIEKLTALVDEAGINTLTVLTMEVPCCGGLLSMARAALAAAKRKIPIKHVMISLQGGIKSEEWL
jgi:ferredoxin